MDKIKKHTKKTSVAALGFLVLILGVIMIPYPGPGWLVVFAGLAILATEFEWASSILDKARERYDAWVNWLAGQVFVVRAFFWLLTCLVVIITIWLLDGYGLLNRWFNLGMSWLNSPLF